MNQERLLMIVDRPHISEKATILADKRNQFTFRVLRTATKPEIKQTVESLFNVKVESVSVLNVKGKTKRFKGHVGKRSDWKKAYVTLSEGHDINFTVKE